MQVFYVNKKKGGLIAFYVAALILLGVAFTSLSGNDTEPAMAEPFRNGSGEDKVVSIAVNVDWGEEYLPGLLEVFETNDVKVSFFLTGRWTDNNPDLAKQIAEAGHEIGNHGYSHTSPNASTKDQIKEEIEKTAQAIQDATGATTTLYAPPSGEEEQHVIEAADELGYSTILWSVDTIDWQKPDAATIIDRVNKKMAPGAIILSHPTASTVEAYKTLIPELIAEGYSFVTVSENLGL